MLGGKGEVCIFTFYVYIYDSIYVIYVLYTYIYYLIAREDEVSEAVRIYALRIYIFVC